MPYLFTGLTLGMLHPSNNYTVRIDMSSNHAGFIMATTPSFEPLIHPEPKVIQGEAMTSILPQVKFTLDDSNDAEGYTPKAPLHGTDTAAGFDMYAASNVHLMPGASRLVSTGVRMAIPDGWFGMICPRSSVASKTPLRIGARIIDSDYRGEVMINMHNDGTTPWTIEVGERIAQIVFMQHLVEMTQVETLDDTERGEGGFGSTGV